MNLETWQTISKNVVFENEWVRLRNDDVIRPDGKPGRHIVLEKRDFVVVIPRFRDRLYLVNQFRYPVQETSWEFPMGGIEVGEDPLKAGQRELEEETGLIAENYQHLAYLWNSNGYSSQAYHVFLAEVLSKGQPHREGTEMGMVLKDFSRQQITEMIKQGQIKDGETVAAFGLY